MREQHFIVADDGSKVSAVGLSPTLMLQASDDSHLLLCYTLRAAANVSISMYDLQGRPVLPLLDGVPVSAGSHTISIPTERLLPGTYICRMLADGVSSTVKVLV